MIRVTHAGTQVRPEEFERENVTLESWRDGRKVGRERGVRRYERVRLQLQSVTHHQVAPVVRRFPFLRGKIPRIINSEAAAAAYLTHSVSPAQSLTGNPSDCVAGESEKEKNKRGKGGKKTSTPATKILLSGKS